MVWSEIINAIDFLASFLSSELAKGLGKAVNMENLKKCPFCGGEAKIKVNESTLNTLIACPSCNVTMKNNFKGHKRIKKLLEELAIEVWNRRVEE